MQKLGGQILPVVVSYSATLPVPVDEDGVLFFSVDGPGSAGAGPPGPCELCPLPSTLLLPSAHRAALHLPLPPLHPCSCAQTSGAHQPGVSGFSASYRLLHEG